MPTEKTKQDYRKLAQHFYDKRLNGEPPTPKKITDALQKCCHQYRPAYWRRLRNAVEFDQREKGYEESAERIKHTRNLMTTISTGEGIIDSTLRGETPPKQKRAKSISPDDIEKLMQAVKELNDGKETSAAIFLVRNLGVRPIELLSLQVDKERGLVHVVGAKKSGGLRGADRVLTLPDDPHIRRNIAGAARIVQRAEREKGGVVHRIQSRLDRISRRLWPRRQARPSLYTFRHALGGNLKAMGLSRPAIAYIMGHQSTKSVEVYGDRRKGSGTIGIKISGNEAQAFQGRENHREAPDGLPESKIPPALRSVADSLKSQPSETPVQQKEKPAQSAASAPPNRFRGPSF
ncbi:site-specific integrase [Halomonas vilamensis]|uniref:Site-specific integrase n=1 Tax=Vreelandella vilamensis TaxID=531309 RepID=A0ABU1H822_9GAMM|nr:site-specific integrase [Halomonas vilamensis]MDR5900457.1 site-specific integrase [Halomonas vilamensis]